MGDFWPMAYWECPRSEKNLDDTTNFKSDLDSEESKWFITKRSKGIIDTQHEFHPS
jgi:hypothetical protein